MVKEYVTKRTRICRACPICDTENEICNANLYINPDTNAISTTPRGGYVKGCGCHLKFKIEKKESFCPAHKWEKEY